jgi:predicted nucleic acid-binding protein
MTLCDTGPLVAILDRRDVDHSRCLAALAAIPSGPMVTTWPCFTEAMYLVGRGGGLRAQEGLWKLVEDGLLELYAPAEGEWRRMRSLMNQYGDAPMDLADASLVVAAESLGARRVFTNDGHFRAYRLHGQDAFELIP